MKLPSPSRIPERVVAPHSRMKVRGNWNGREMSSRLAYRDHLLVRARSSCDAAVLMPLNFWALTGWEVVYLG